MNHIAEFNGIGGFQLAAHWMGWNNIAHVENDDFCNQVANYWFPESDQYYDIKKFNAEKYRKTNDLIITGGFPCQGFSSAGQRRGTEDDRYLWPEMLNTIKQSNPRWVVAENVTGILTMVDQSSNETELFAKVEGRNIVRYPEVDYYEAVYTRQTKMLIDSICKDLEQIGYEVQPIVIPAASVGAPHKRDRTWIVAHSGGKQLKNWTQKGDASHKKEKEARLYDRFERFGNSWNASDTTEKRLQRSWENRFKVPQRYDPKKVFKRNYPRQDWAEWPTQSPVCSRDDGVSAKLDGITFPKWRAESIKALGNAIVPQVAFEIFKAIQCVEDQHSQHTVTTR